MKDTWWKVSTSLLRNDRGKSKLRSNPSDISSGSRGPPGPVKIGHKKDGRQRQLHRFHVSRPPLTRPLDPLLDILQPFELGMNRRIIVKYNAVADPRFPIWGGGRQHQWSGRGANLLNGKKLDQGGLGTHIPVTLLGSANIDP